jgi:hypothetical protein
MPITPRMKTFYNYTLAGITGLLLLTGIQACKKPTDDINLIVNTSTLSKAPTLLQFVNSNAGSQTAVPASFTVTISGPDAALVQVDGGGTDFTATNGVLPISLTKQANPTVANPVVFHVYASLAGYSPVSQTIVITGNQSSMQVIPLVEYAKPASGTASNVTQTAVTGGVTSSAVAVNTSTNATTTERSMINIPAGTQLLDVNKSAISSTQLKSSVAYFGTDNTAAYGAFPGGFQPNNVVGPNGQRIAGGTTFVTAGLMTINMTAGATEVKGFSKPVTVTMQINNNLINPQTKQKVKAGDVIPIWSLNEKSGQWTYETTATISNHADGKLAVIFPIQHLSGWSANWYSQTCGSSLTVNLRTSQQLNGDYLVSLTTANEQPVSSAAVSRIVDGTKAVLNDIPTDAGDLKVVVYARNGNQLTKIGETATFSACAKGSVEVNLFTQPTVDYVKTTVNIVAKCTTKQVVAYPSAWLALKDDNTGELTNIYMTDGVATTNLVNGHGYSITTNYANRSYTSAVFQLNKGAGVAIPEVKGLSGTANFDAASNSIIVNANFLLNNCN